MKADTHVYSIPSGDRRMRDVAAGVLAVPIVLAVIGLGTWTYISHQSEMASQAKADKAALRSELIVQSSPYATVMCDSEGWIVQSNLAAEMLLGWPHAELVGKSALDLLPEDDREHVTQEMNRSTIKMRSYDGNWVMLSKDTHTRVLHNDGNLLPVIVSVRVIKVFDEIQFIIGMRSESPAQQPIVPQKPVPLPELPTGNASLERAINQMAAEVRAK